MRRTRIDLLGALGVTAIALGVYVATLAPGLTFAHNGSDGGDLIAAAYTLGVPHPTGYPTYTLLAWLFSRLPLGTIAYRVNLLSALCAALVGGIFYLVDRLLAAPEDETWTSRAVSAAAALTLAFSSLLWSQAVISEVYTLLLLFAALLLWLILRWRSGDGDPFLWAAGLALGLGLGNHLTLIFIAPAAAYLLWPERRRWLRLRAWLPTLVLLLSGLLVYVYLPLAAAHRPPVNWGDPRTWQGFWWVVSAKQYQGFAFGLPTIQVPNRLGNWALLFGEQFGWWGLVLALFGGWQLRRREQRLVQFALIWGGLVAVYAFFYDTGDSYVYLLPVMMLLALGWAEGVRRLVQMAGQRSYRWGRIALVVLLLLPLGSLALHWQANDLRGDWSDHTYAYQLLEPVEPDSLIVVRGDQPTFALWYAVYAEGARPDVAIVNGPMLAFIWYRQHVRHLYPDLVVGEPTGQPITWDDLVHNLVADNLPQRAVYLTDPKEAWADWFETEPEGRVPIERVTAVH